MRGRLDVALAAFCVAVGVVFLAFWVVVTALAQHFL